MDEGVVLRESGLVFLCGGLLAAAAAVLQLDTEQLTHQRGAGRLGGLVQELLDARRASLDPGVFEAIADLIDLSSQRQGELFADSFSHDRTSRIKNTNGRYQVQSRKRQIVDWYWSFVPGHSLLRLPGPPDQLELPLDRADATTDAGGDLLVGVALH